MKRLFLPVVFLLSFGLSVVAQSGPGPVAAPKYMGKRAADPAACTEGSWYYNTASHAFKYCSAANTWSAVGGAGGSGTVTATGGSLTANSVVLGAGTVDTKVVAGITTNGTSKLTLGVAGTSVGSVDFKNATSGTVTVQPVTGALGTSTLSLPATSATLQTKVASTTDKAVARFSGTTGDEQNSLATIDDLGNLSLPCSTALKFGTSSIVQFDCSGDTQFNAAAGTGARIMAGSYVRDFIGGSAVDAAISSGFNLTSTGQFGYVSSTDPTVAPDTGFGRVAAKVAKVTDGSSGSGWIQDAGLSRVSANVTNATATKAVITGLSATVAAGRKYAGSITLIAKNSTAAEGLQFDFNGGSATFTNIEFGFQATPPGVTLGVVISSVAGTSLTATTATTTDVVYTIFFTCVVNAAGTIIPQVAEVSHTSGTATVVLGSTMRLEDIP